MTRFWNTRLLLVLTVLVMLNFALNVNHLIAEHKTCQRVNVLRAQDNDVTFSVYQLAIGAYHREHRLAQTERDDQPVHAHSAQQALDQAKRQRHTDLTNCDGAVLIPWLYIPPNSHPYYQSSD